MKCEHCGRNEATFFYQSSVNGHVTQVHLLEPFLAGFGSRMLTEFPEPDQPQQAQPAERAGLVDKAQQEELRSQRRRNALQEQLKAAVESENYEEAARLRDELRTLPPQQ